MRKRGRRVGKAKLSIREHFSSKEVSLFKKFSRDRRPLRICQRDYDPMAAILCVPFGRNCASCEEIQRLFQGFLAMPRCHHNIMRARRRELSFSQIIFCVYFINDVMESFTARSPGAKIYHPSTEDGFRKFRNLFGRTVRCVCGNKEAEASAR